MDCVAWQWQPGRTVFKWEQEIKSTETWTVINIDNHLLRLNAGERAALQQRGRAMITIEGSGPGIRHRPLHARSLCGRPPADVPAGLVLRERCIVYYNIEGIKKKATTCLFVGGKISILWRQFVIPQWAAGKQLYSAKSWHSNKKTVTVL